MPRPLRIALLHASVGTGHTVAAQALAEWFARAGCHTVCYDMLSFAPQWIGGAVRTAYVEMAARYGELWRWFYRTTDRPDYDRTFFGCLGELISRVYAPRLCRKLKEFAPHGVVFTHFFGLEAIRRLMHPIPMFYVNTDFISHALAINRCFSGWFVATHDAAMQHTGILAHITGIPVMPSYTALPSMEEARCALSLPADARVVLAAGGGMGVGSMDSAIRAALDAGAYVMAVCGRNESLRERLMRSYGVRAEGFVDMLPRYAASDVVVMKPGGMCTSEALCVGTPMVVINPIPGQEEYNGEHVVRGGAARYFSPHVLSELLTDDGAMSAMRRAALEMGRPFAGQHIARAVMDILAR